MATPESVLLALEELLWRGRSRRRSPRKPAEEELGQDGRSLFATGPRHPARSRSSGKKTAAIRVHSWSKLLLRRLAAGSTAGLARVITCAYEDP